MALSLLVLARRRKAFMALFFCAGLLAISFFPVLSGKVMNRITMTYKGDYATETVNLGSAGQINLEGSAAARVESLRNVVLEKLPKHPFLDLGVTGIGLGDTQYALLLGETGITGFFIFFWMIYELFFTARMVSRGSRLCAWAS